MKIWYQSATTYGFDSKFERYGKTLEEICSSSARAGTKIHIKGLPVISRDVVKYNYLQFYEKAQIINNMLRAEEEGYSAFVIGCDLEPGLEEGKALVDIPVVGISEASYHLAMMLGNMFAVLTSSMAFYNIFKQQIQKYCLDAKYLPGPYFYESTGEEMAEALENSDTLINNYKKVARKAVADGASVIILNPAFIAAHAYKAGWINEGGAVVLNPIIPAIKMAEMMVDLKELGIEPSRQIGVYANMGKRERDDAIRTFAGVHKIF